MKVNSAFFTEKAMKKQAILHEIFSGPQQKYAEVPEPSISKSTPPFSAVLFLKIS